VFGARFKGRGRSGQMAVCWDGAGLPPKPAPAPPGAGPRPVEPSTPQRKRDGKGHSKWSQIKRQKAVVDAKRGGRVLPGFGRENHGGRPRSAPIRRQLSVAHRQLRKAKAAGVPHAHIDRAIAKGSGRRGEADSLEAVRYEGLWPWPACRSWWKAFTPTTAKPPAAAEPAPALGKNGGNHR